MSSSNLHRLGVWVLILGALIMSVSSWFRFAGQDLATGAQPFFDIPRICHSRSRQLGDNISPTEATRQVHRLVTHGPYRWIRHPRYTGGLVFAISVAVLTSMWWLAVGLIVPLTVLFLRTRREEANLIHEFGDEYRRYQARTKRFIPFV